MTYAPISKMFPLVAAMIALQFWTLHSAAEPSTLEGADSRTQAEEAFSEGDAAFDVQDYEAALAHFRSSYEWIASPNSRLMIARCLLELRRLDEAYDEFLGVIADAEDAAQYADARATAERERDALLNRLAWLTVDMSALGSEASLTVAGRVRSDAQSSQEFAVTPGLTLVEAISADGVVAQAEVHLAAGRRASARLVPGQTVQVGRKAQPRPEPQTPEAVEEKSPPPESESARARSPSPQLLPWAIVAAGVGVGGGVMFGVFGSKSRSDFRSLQSSCAQGICPEGSQGKIDSGRRNQLLANIGLGVAVAGVATGGVLFFVHNQRQTGLQVGLSSVLFRGQF